MERSSALVVRILQPWFENLGKRQVKAPKVYVRDSGILHALLGISVVYPGPTRYSLAEKIEVTPLKECIETLMKLR